MSRAHWENEADRWIAWARTPEHDAYWDYAPLFFREIVPRPGRRTLEVGCGEGRVARDLVARGHRVVGIDLTWRLLRAAREADDRASYVEADAALLPFPEGSFDLVVAYNSLMDVDDLSMTTREARRVLVDGGRFAICVTHPIADAGRFEDATADARFTIGESYLETRPFSGSFERDGLSISFSGMTYPLEAYGRALEAAGFTIERIREPRLPEGAIVRDPTQARWARVPNFLFLLAVASLGA